MEKSRMQTTPDTAFVRTYRICKFYLIKLPFVYIAAPLGFLFDFIITFPYIIMTEIDGRRKK
ncbi:MAG: hypothetical protein GXP53_03535 [Deltaproteobacteria bacterium]|nr:hypothetical protein [Deltaproteobacteria bacterium]